VQLEELGQELGDRERGGGDRQGVEEVIHDRDHLSWRAG